jgi:hypothetical protein
MAKVFFTVVFAATACAVTYMLLRQLEVVPPQDDVDVRILRDTVAPILPTLVPVFLKGTLVGPDPAPRDIDLAGRWARRLIYGFTVVLVLVISITLFGPTYARLLPGFGGGAGRMAEVLIKSDGEKTPGTWIAGLVFDERDEGLSLLFFECSSSEKKPVSLRIPKDQILRVKFPLGAQYIVPASKEEAGRALMCR